MSFKSAAVQGPANALIHPNALDTLTACRHLLAYVEEATQKVDSAPDIHV